MIIGFGSKYDFEVLRNEFKTFPNKPSNFVDLLSVIRSTRESNKLKDIYYDVKLSGLSKVCFETLGKKLDKREQISDWSRRPLRERQKFLQNIQQQIVVQRALH